MLRKVRWMVALAGVWGHLTWSGFQRPNKLQTRSRTRTWTSSPAIHRVCSQLTWSRFRSPTWSHIKSEWKNYYNPAGPGWTASFEDDFSCRDFASIAIDTGSNVWGSSTAQLSETEEKGWATFTDFQPFCWWGRGCVLVDIVYSGHVDTVLNVLVFCSSDAGPRCSSPVDSENPNKQSQNEESEWLTCLFLLKYIHVKTFFLHNSSLY